MANPAFPASLPGPVLASMQWTSGENVIRTQMDAGVAKLRRRYTAVPEDMSCEMVIDRAQLQVLYDFHDITLATVLPFDWRDWRKPFDDTALVVCRFKKRPTVTAVDNDEDLLKVTLELELLTTFQGTFLLDVAPLST